MKRSWHLAAVGMLFVFLTGCQFLSSMFGLEKADLIVKNVEPVEDSSGTLSKLRFVLANIGGTDAYGVEYAARAEMEEPSGTPDTVELYRDVITLKAGGEEQIELDHAADIQEWMNAAGIDRTAIDTTAGYFLRIVIDPGDKIAETVEGNNETLTSHALLLWPAG